jgi:hypothetical protein
LKSKKIVIIGSRRRDEQEDFDAVYNEFRKVYNNGDIIVSGGCPKGGDRFAEIIARRIGATEENGKLIIHRPEPVPKGSPRWKWAEVFYKRNTVVAKETESDSVVIACCAPDRTGGTEDTIRKVMKHDLIDLNNIIIV